MFAIGREFERRSNVVPGEFGEIADDLIGGHPRREVREDVVDRDARADKGRLPAPNARASLDQRHQIHTGIVLISTELPSQNRPRRTPSPKTAKVLAGGNNL